MIKVNGYTAGITISGDVVSGERGIELVEDNATSGSSTFTIEEDGTYLIVVSNSYQGSRSVTLPQGRTAIINQDIETTYGMTVVVADLQEDDVVTMSAAPATWTAFSKQIYKLTNVTASTVYGSQANNDGAYTYTLPTTGNYLVVGMSFGRTSTDYRDDTLQDKAAKSISNEVGANTITKVYADAGENMPEFSMYGYDGGGVFFVALNID